MMTPAIELAPMVAMLRRVHATLPPDLRLEHRQLRGGLEAASVSRVVARYRDPAGRPRTFSCVVKRVSGTATREMRVYRQLVAAHVPGMAPRLLAADEPSADSAVLYLESLRRVSAWPWRALGLAREVLQQAARLHALRPRGAARAVLTQWDYERELPQSARRTLERLEQVVRRREFSVLAGGLPPTRRLVASLPEVRRRLLAFGPLGSGPLHGDLHPGNAIVRRRGGRQEPVLIDWGRARIGSPLEDVSSWLQCLAGFEPEARRRHDTLLAGYLSARGMEARLGSDLRAAYWLAGASNALAGALLHHLSVLLDERATTAQRNGAARSAQEWVRVLRRADAHWS